MKKEKEKENLTLKQLEDKKRKAIKTSMLSFILVLVVAVAVVVTMDIGNSKESQYTAMMIIVFAILPLFLCEILIEEYDRLIELKKKEMRVRLIKDVAKEGNIKEFVTLKKEEMIEYILLIGIDRFVIQGVNSEEDGFIKNKDFTVSIFLKNGYCMSPIQLSGDKFLELINQDVKEQILDKLITDIRLCSETEDETELTITGKDKFIYYNESMIKDDELLEIFELKE